MKGDTSSDKEKYRENASHTSQQTHLRNTVNMNLTLW